MATKKRKELGRNGGYYWFMDGSVMWVYGMSAAEKRAYERVHGKVRFHTTNREDFNMYESIVAPYGRVSTPVNKEV